MVLSPSSIVPLHYVLCPLDIAYLSPMWGPRGRGRAEIEGQGPGPLDLNGALVWGGGWLAPKMGGSTEVSKHLGSGL